MIDFVELRARLIELSKHPDPRVQRASHLTMSALGGIIELRSSRSELLEAQVEELFTVASDHWIAIVQEQIERAQPRATIPHLGGARHEAKQLERLAEACLEMCRALRA